MAFFSGLETTERKPASAFDNDCAIRLHAALTAAGSPPTRTRTSASAHQFRLLRRSIEQERIEDVLNWFCSNIRTKTVPLALSAKTFVTKFNQIEAAKERLVVVEVVITKEAQAIVERVNYKYWPPGTKQDVPVVVQISHDAYKKFRSRLYDTHHQLEKKAKRSKEETNVFRFASHLKEKLPSPGHFVEHWMLDLSSMFERWLDWKGELHRHAFSSDHKNFTSMGRGLSVSYCGSIARWDRLMEMMNAC